MSGVLVITGMSRGAAANQMFDNVRLVYETFPDKHLIFTEGCVDSFDPKKIDEWKFGEQYGRSMINDFNNGTVGWTDWNILLDERGGPNHVENFCFAPVHANTKTGELTYLSSLLLHRPLFKVHSTRRQKDCQLAQPQSASFHRVSQSRRKGDSGRDESE